MAEEAAPIKPDDRESNQDDDGISLLDLAIVIAKRKGLILGLPLAVAVIAAIVAFLLPNIYTGTTKILPPQQTPSASSVILSQLGSLAGGLASGAPGLKNPNDLYIGMLRSRTVADNLIERFELRKRYDVHYMEQARAKLLDITSITSGRDSIITIQAEDKDPKFAAELANAYVDELFKLTKVLAVTETSQRRLFFERQLAQARENLTKAETSAKKALEQGGVLKVDEQGRSLIETAARLRAQITVKEVQLSSMRTFASENNPDLILVQKELEALKRELAKAEGTGPRSGSNETSGKGMDNLALLRDMKYHETVYELLARQYELAKIDEARDASIIQVLDKALEPERKSKPVRIRIVLLSALAATLVGVILAFVLESLTKMHNDPRTAERWQAFMQQMRLRAWSRNRRL